MRVFCLAEGPPSADSLQSNGSTMISAHLLAGLAEDVDVDLAYFATGPVELDPHLRHRVRSTTVLGVRDPRLALLAQPATRLPRATWQRRASREDLARLSGRADVTYVHGLHALADLDAVEGPVVTHLVDPWSDYWRERAGNRRGPSRWYDLVQSDRARHLEDLCAERSRTVLVVNEADAERCRRRWDAAVLALPNGVTAPRTAVRARSRTTMVFVGTLDYPPNLEALDILVREVLPAVRSVVPDVELRVVGRRPTAAVAQLAETPGVRLVGPVADVSAVFAEATVAVYPGRTGRGTKNTVGEALGAGCPVVASIEAARGWEPGGDLHTGSTSEEIAGAVVDVVRASGREERRHRRSVRTWQEAATEFEGVLRDAVGGT